MSFENVGTLAYHRGDVSEAMRCFDAAIAENVKDWRSITKLGSVHLEQGRLGHAYVFASAAVRLNPCAETLSDLGRVFATWGDNEAALELFQMAHEQNPSHIPSMNNAGLACLNMARIDEAWTWFTKAAPEDVYLHDRDVSDVQRNKAFVHLFRQDWGKAWRAYNLGIGKGDRVARWQGVMHWQPGITGGGLMIWGEQGIGDEIQFASCIPDALESAEQVTIETMPRLVGLFSRSFPEAKVIGTRYQPEDSIGIIPAYQCSIAQLPGHFRTSQEDFPGTPYLKACSARRAAVRGLLDPMPRKKKIGIAWTGGTAMTGYYDRGVELPALMDALSDLDAEIISLEHTLSDDVQPEIMGVHVFPWLTHRDLDYDNTAALVAELDLVVAVPTAVAHLAGALGTKTLVMLNKHPAWRCGGPTMPWYHSLEVMRDWTFESVRARIEEVLHGTE